MSRMSAEARLLRQGFTDKDIVALSGAHTVGFGSEFGLLKHQAQHCKHRLQNAVGPQKEESSGIALLGRSARTMVWHVGFEVDSL